MSAVSEGRLSAKTNIPPISKTSDAPSLATRVCLVAIVCIAIIALGSYTGYLGLSVLGATAVGAGSLYWMLESVKSEKPDRPKKTTAEPKTPDELRASAEPKAAEPKIDPSEVVRQLEQARLQTEEENRARFALMMDVFGGEDGYNQLPDVGELDAWDRSLSSPKHAISRGLDKKTKNPIILFQLQEKSDYTRIVTSTFCYTTFPNNGDNNYCAWQSNMDNVSHACFPRDIVNERTLSQIKALINGTHPEFLLVGPPKVLEDY